MKEYFIKFFHYFCFVALLVSCQNIKASKENQIKSILSSDNGQLDLSQSTLEQQSIEKTKAEQFLLEARKKRIIIEVQPIEGTTKKPEINIALYARQTKNAVGQKIFNRIKIKKKKSDPCLSFLSNDDAQRFFLTNGGPKTDFMNLDPDGDGFACVWNPTQYRTLIAK